MIEPVRFPTPPRQGAQMRKVLRLAALLNTAYQGAVGLIALLSPIVVAQLFHIGIPDPSQAAVIRLLGALACGNAMVLAIVGRQGPGIELLARWALLSGVLNLIANVWICLGGDLPWSTLSVPMGLQGFLVLVLIFWIRTPGAADAKGSSAGIGY